MKTLSRGDVFRIIYVKATTGLCEGYHRSPLDSAHKGPILQSFDSFFVDSRTGSWTRSWVAVDLIHHHAHGMSLQYIDYAKDQETLDYVLSTAATDTLMLKHQAISIYNAD